MDAFGKGLGSLIPGSVVLPTHAPDEGDTLVVLQVDPARIDSNPRQPRGAFDEGKLQELTESIREYGILEPLLVTEKSGGRFELIAGERRLRAAKAVGLRAVPVLVRHADDLEKLELSLIENLQRQDLNSIEEAEGYRELGHSFGLTQEEVAKKVGRSRETISNALRLLELPTEMQKAIVAGKISAAHGRTLLAIDSPSAREEVFRRMVGEKLTVREAQEVAAPKIRRKRASLKDPVLLADEMRLRETLNTKVQIEKRGERGRIIVQFYSDEDYGEIVGKLSGEQEQQEQ